MNRKQLTILIVLVAVIGGAGWMIFKKQNNAYMNGDQKLGQKLFPKLPINDVAHIEIKQTGADLNLVKQDDLWRVKERNNYPANFSQISEFLVKAEDLKIAQSEEIGASQFAKLELLEPAKGSGSGTQLDLKDKSGKTIQSAILGKKVIKKSERASQFGDEGFPVGRYIALPSDHKNVFVISDSLSDIEAKPENWLNKDFFKIEKVKSVSLVSTNATNSWKLSRTNETSGWTLADTKAGEELDTNKVSSVANALSSPSFLDVAVDTNKTGLEKPLVATLETFDGFTYTLKVGKPSGENYDLTMTVSATFPKERVAGKDEKPDDKTKLDKEFADKTKQLEEKLKREKGFEKWTYVVATYTLDPLLRDRAQLMVEKKEEPKKAESKPAPKPGQFFDPTGLEK